MLCPMVDHAVTPCTGEGRTIAQVANVGAENSVELVCLECGYTSIDEATRNAFKEEGD